MAYKRKKVVKTTFQHYTVRMPRSLTKAIKLAAIDRDTTVQDLVLDAVCRYLHIAKPTRADADIQAAATAPAANQAA